MMRRGDDAGYDRSLTMFSPEGRLYQVEYALEAVRRGTLVIALKSKAGATIVTRKKFTKLMDSSTIQKIFIMDEHIGCAIAGLHADSRILVDYARVQCQVHRLTYNEPVRLQTITRKLADIKQQYSQHGGVRPFGSSLLIVGIDPDGTPRITTTSPSGTYWSWRATAMGQNSESAKDELNKSLDDNMTIDQLVKLGIKILKESTDEEFENETLSIAVASKEDKKFAVLEYEEIKKF